MIQALVAHFFLYSTIESACLLLAWSFEPHRGYTRLGEMMTAIVRPNWKLTISQDQHQQLPAAEEVYGLSKSRNLISAKILSGCV